MEKNVQVINEVFGFDKSIYDIPEKGVEDNHNNDKSKKEKKD